MEFINFSPTCFKKILLFYWFLLPFLPPLSIMEYAEQGTLSDKIA